MSAIATAIVGGAVIGAYASNRAAGAAGDAASQAAESEWNRLQEDKRRYEEMKPYRTAGIESVTSLSDIMAGRQDPTAALEADPGYKFRTTQGGKAIDRFLAARGYRLGGRALKEGIRYNQDFATGEYQNLINNKFRLAGFSGQAQPSTSTAGLSNALMAGGQAQAGAYEGYNQAIQGGAQNYMTYRTYQDWMNKLPNTSSPNTLSSGNSINTWTPQSSSLGAGTTYGG